MAGDGDAMARSRSRSPARTARASEAPVLPGDRPISRAPVLPGDQPISRSLAPMAPATSDDAQQTTPMAPVAEAAAAGAAAGRLWKASVEGRTFLKRFQEMKDRFLPTVIPLPDREGFMPTVVTPQKQQDESDEVHSSKKVAKQFTEQAATQAKPSTTWADCLIRETPWPCAMCRTQPFFTCWYPVDGTGPLDTQHRMCEQCHWKLGGRGDKRQMLDEDTQMLDEDTQTLDEATGSSQATMLDSATGSPPE